MQTIIISVLLVMTSYLSKGYASNESLSYILGITSYVEAIANESGTVNYHFRFGELAEEELALVSLKCSKWNISSSEKLSSRFRTTLKEAINYLARSPISGAKPPNLEKVDHASQILRELTDQHKIVSCLVDSNNGKNRYYLFKTNRTSLLIYIGFN